MSHPVPLEDEKLAKAQEIISYHFTNRFALRGALQLADGIHQDGNRNLALLGDTVIKLILIKEGLRREATRGVYHSVTTLVCNMTLKNYFVEF